MDDKQVKKLNKKLDRIIDLLEELAGQEIEITISPPNYPFYTTPPNGTYEIWCGDNTSTNVEAGTLEDLVNDLFSHLGH